MKVLVTGSTGFIGAALCRGLVENGYTVRAFHRSSSLTNLLDGLPVEHAIGDLTQPATIQEAMQGIDAVFHTGALMGRPTESGQLYAVTVEGTRAVLTAAKAAGVRRFIHTSSVAALGVPDQPPGRKAPPVLMDERHTWNFQPARWPYGYAKYLAEIEVQRAVGNGLDAVIVNPTLVLGAGDQYRRTSSPIVQMARQRFPGSVEGGLNVIHIRDTIAGHLAALEHGRTGERYILGGNNLTIPLFMQKLAAAVNVPSPAVVFPGRLVRAVAGLAVMLANFITLPVSPEVLHLAGMYMFYSSRKSQVELGLPVPRQPEEAIADAYAWFVANGAVASDKKPIKSQKTTPL